ncbi:hypothetical protein Tco_0672177 [Tanacetum coccineum]
MAAITNHLHPLVPSRIKHALCYNMWQQSGFAVHANVELARLTSKLGALQSKYQEADKRLRSRDKKHRKFKADRTTKEVIAAEK